VTLVVKNGRFHFCLFQFESAAQNFTKPSKNLPNYKFLAISIRTRKHSFSAEGEGMGIKNGKVARFRIQRRLGLELPGLGKPGALERRPYPPGEKGNKRKKFSDFALRLEEKQKVRCNYELREEQLRRFIRQAKRGKGTNWVSKLVGLLESRLDNVVFRLGFAPSIRSARQLCSHGHIRVDDNAITIGSYILKPGQKITLNPKAVENQIYLRAKQAPRLEVPDYLRKDDQGGVEVGTVQMVPRVEHVPFAFDAGLFTEYYAARKA
jgi:small subunit ribosomal protein S4